MCVLNLVLVAVLIKSTRIPQGWNRTARNGGAAFVFVRHQRPAFMLLKARNVLILLFCSQCFEYTREIELIGASQR